MKKQLQPYNLKPSHLLKENPHNWPCEWDKASVTPNRLKALLDRGSALGFALEKWKRSGLWVRTENDEEYPKRLSHRLATKAPPILFGYGDRRHLNKGGIAVVGSRHADREDLDLTHVVGEEATRQGYAIVSGGGRGVDESAMLGTLERNGTALGDDGKQFANNCSFGQV